MLRKSIGSYTPTTTSILPVVSFSHEVLPKEILTRKRADSMSSIHSSLVTYVGPPITPIHLIDLAAYNTSCGPGPGCSRTIEEARRMVQEMSTRDLLRHFEYVQGETGVYNTHQVKTF
jgi:hypothetical protein